MAERRLLTPTQLAKLLGVNRSAVRHWREQGCPVARVDGETHLYDPDAVRRWREQTLKPTKRAASGAKGSGGAANTGAGATLIDARRILTLEQGAIASLKRRKLARELVLREEVQAELALLLSAARSVLESMPDSQARFLCEQLGIDYTEHGARVRDSLRAVALDTMRKLADAPEKLS